MGSNKRISELGQVPRLDGQEEIVVVQGAVTQKATIDQVRNSITPTPIIVSDENNVDLNAEEYKDARFIVLKWDGAQGSMVITLPDITSAFFKYHSYRFITDGTFLANTIAEIATFGDATTIDGLQSTSINKSYEGIEIWNDGVEWFIIQKKA
jgi:hypothetical protein